MSYLDTASGAVVSRAGVDERAGFIRRTFLHLAGSVALFAIIEAYFQSLGWGEKAMVLLSKSSWSWLVVMAAFAGVSMLADKWARDDYSKTVQYAGLGLFIVAEAIIFIPMIYMATRFGDGLLQNAALITGGLVAGLSLVALTTKKDFSFLGPILKIGFMIALAVIVAAIIFGFQLGMFFSAVMIVFAAGSILYSLSNIIHVYRTDQHVAASLSLFSSVGLLFWYVLQFMMSMGGDD